MEPELPLGPWRGYWTVLGESERQPLTLDVSGAGDRFSARGEDSAGGFTLAGEMMPWGEERTWVKSPAGGPPVRFVTTRVGESTGFVGRWFREDGTRGEFALWPGTSPKSPPHLLDALPTDSISFRCICGETLEMPVDTRGMRISCPWCQEEVVAPEAGGQALRALPVPEAPDPAELFRCPGCASPAIESGGACALCGIPTVAPDAFELHPASFEQEIVSPESADWILRKFAWLVRLQGRQEVLRRPPLLPSKDWHPEVWEPTEAAAGALLGRLQRAADLDDLPLRLTLLGEEELSLREVSASADGEPECFSAPVRKDGSLRFAIGEAQLAERLPLIGAFAHGLGHLYGEERLRLKTSPPLDQEFLADILTILLGFGLFTCEAAFRFLSWPASRRPGPDAARTTGFLSQPDLSFALALWTCVQETDAEIILAHLGTNTQSYFRNAFRFFSQRPELLGPLKVGQLGS